MNRENKIVAFIITAMITGSVYYICNNQRHQIDKEKVASKRILILWQIVDDHDSMSPTTLHGASSSTAVSAFKKVIADKAIVADEILPKWNEDKNKYHVYLRSVLITYRPDIVYIPNEKWYRDLNDFVKEFSNAKVIWIDHTNEFRQESISHEDAGSFAATVALDHLNKLLKT